MEGFTWHYQTSEYDCQFMSFMETLSWTAFTLANPCPESWVTLCKAAAMALFNICFSKVHPSSSIKASRMLLAADACFSYTALRQKERQSRFPAIRLVTRKERESPVFRTNPEDRGKTLIKMKKQGCRISINPESYSHSLILNSLTPVSISLAFQFCILHSLKHCPQPV